MITVVGMTVLVTINDVNGIGGSSGDGGDGGGSCKGGWEGRREGGCMVDNGRGE